MRNWISTIPTEDKEIKKGDQKRTAGPARNSGKN